MGVSEVGSNSPIFVCAFIQMLNHILSASDVDTAACRRTLPIPPFTLPPTSQPNFGSANISKEQNDNTYINRLLDVLSSTKELILNTKLSPC